MGPKAGSQVLVPWFGLNDGLQGLGHGLDPKCVPKVDLKIGIQGWALRFGSETRTLFVVLRCGHEVWCQNQISR